MAVLQHSSSKPKPSTSSCFLGCFGFSCKASSEKQMQLSDELKVKSGNRRWRFHLMKSGSKMVPVDTTVSGKPDRSRDLIHSLNCDNYKVSSSKFRTPATGNSPAEIQEAEPDPIHEENRYEDSQHLIVLDKKQSKKEVRSTSRRRKITFVIPKNKSAITPFSQSVSSMSQAPKSLPPPKEKKPTTTTKTTKINNNDNSNSNEGNSKEDSFGGKFEPVVGMTIILATIIIMLVWGTLCAILCTSAWFFLTPHLKSVVRPQLVTRGKEDLDFNSEEYKKKVILQGLLQRDHENIR